MTIKTNNIYVSIHYSSRIISSNIILLQNYPKNVNFYLHLISELNYTFSGLIGKISYTFTRIVGGTHLQKQPCVRDTRLSHTHGRKK